MAIHPHTHSPLPKKKAGILTALRYWLAVRRMYSLLYYPHIIPQGKAFVNSYFLHFSIYIWRIFVYDNREQSRRPCVKCCQNGELSDRRRALPAMRYPHPLRHIGDPPLCSNVLSPALSLSASIFTPPTLLRVGIFLWLQ